MFYGDIENIYFMIAAYFYMFYKPLQGISDFYGLFKEFFHSDFLEKMKGINFNG